MNEEQDRRPYSPAGQGRRPAPGAKRLFTVDEPEEPLSRFNGECEVVQIHENYVGQGLWGVQVKNAEGVAWPHELTTIR